MDNKIILEGQELFVECFNYPWPTQIFIKKIPKKIKQH